MSPRRQRTLMEALLYDATFFNYRGMPSKVFELLEVVAEYAEKEENFYGLEEVEKFTEGSPYV